MKSLKIIAIMILFVATSRFLKTDYTKTTTVYQVIEPSANDPEGMVVCIDNNGMKYTFKGSEDWMEGDICELTMNDNGTPNYLNDDYAVKTIYKGYIY